MRFKRSIFLIPLGVTGVACAQSVELSLAEYQTSYTVYVNTQGASGSPLDVYSTMQTLSTSSQTTGLNLPTDIELFCVELGQDAPTSPTPYSLLGAAAADSKQSGSDTQSPLDTLTGIGTSGIGPARATNLEYLYGYALGGSYSLQSVYNQAVFQMAVWQLSHSTSFTLSTNSTGFYFSNPNNSNLIGDTQTLLNDVYSHESSISAAELDVLHSGTAQDYILPVNSSGQFVPIPEPSACASLIGLASLGYALRRRSRTGLA